MDFMDKATAFLKAVNDAGLNFSNSDGETAVVCKDCVAVICKSGNEVGVNFINRVENLEYEVGFTQEDVDNFMILDELMGGDPE